LAGIVGFVAGRAFCGTGPKGQCHAWLPITSSILYIPSSVTTQNTASATLRDYGTARIRGGWAYENFLPYVAAGLSVARIDSTQTVLARYAGTGVTT
jgi:hypothetical protein